MILTSSHLQMGTTKPPANAGEKTGPTGTVEQVVTLNAGSSGASTATAGQNAASWFSQQGKDLGAGVFGALGDRVGSTIRGDGGPANYGGADAAYTQQSLAASPLVIGGVVLAGLALAVAVLKK